MTISSLNWFDALAVVFVGFTVWRGYHKGAAEELLPTMQWTAVVFAGAYTHQYFGQLLRTASGANLATCYATVYLGEVLVFLVVFRWLRKMLTDRIVAAQIFGKTEHVLGLVLAAVKSVAGVLLVVAILNAFDMAPTRKWLQKHGNDPTFQALALTISERIQRDIAIDSFSGGTLRKKFPHLLATPVQIGTAPDASGAIQERRRLLDQSSPTR